MKQKKSNRKKEIILAVLIVLWLAVIWGHSFMSGESSGDESSFFKNLLEPFLELFVGKGNVTDHLVRKIAHFSEFAVLGVLFESMIQVKKREHFLNQSFIFFASVSVAVADESIQLISPDRGPSVKDVLLDSAGAASGILITLLIFTIAHSIKKRRS